MDEQLNVYALLTATQAAEYAQVSVACVCNWAARGYLPIAPDERGDEIRDDRGRPRYRLLDVAKAEIAAKRNKRGERKHQVA